MSPADRYRKILVLLTLIALPLVFFAPAWLGGVALVHGDGWLANFGLRLLTGTMIKDGVIPLWNPYIFAGMPLLASIYPGVLYPFNWVFALLSPGIAMQLVVITTYHIALIGAWLYARSIGISRFGAVISATAFAFGGYMITSVGQTSNIATAAWLGWILLAIERLAQSRSWLHRVLWAAAGAILIAVQFFAGVPQITWYTALVAGAYSVFLVATRSGRLSFIAGLVLMVTSALLLSAVQLLPLRELQLQSVRAAIDYATFGTYSFPPKQVLALVFPYLFGGAARPPYGIPYWGEWGIFATSGYTGLLGLMLALAALVRQKGRMALFWASVAVVSLVVSFGAYLPFKLNHLFFAIPVNNLFRAPFRHMFEFTFAIGVLAGIGLDRVANADKATIRRLLRFSLLTIALLVAMSLLIYLFTQQATSTGIASMVKPEMLVPTVFSVLSATVLYGFAKFRTAPWKLALLVVLLADLCSFGQFLEWRNLKFSADEAIRTDPPTVKFLKAREPDPHSFRILSYSRTLFGPNAEMLIAPNLSIARGLESANGYDMLQMSQVAKTMGDMSANGIISRIESLGLADRSFDLLNAKYLLVERPVVKHSIELNEIRFNTETLDATLENDNTVEFEGNGTVANELAIVSALSHSGNVPDGAPVLKLRVHTKDGRQIDHELQAGRDTSEWAFDRADVRASVKHSRAKIVESFPAESFDAHRYLGRVRFERSAVNRLELQHLRNDSQVMIFRISLFDSESRTSTPLTAQMLSAGRWNKLASFGDVDIFENLRVLPRAWFTKRVIALDDDRILKRIQGRDENASFNPLEEAIVSTGNPPEQMSPVPEDRQDSNASVTISRYDPQRISLKTRSDYPGFLVLSEIYYPGWTASIDGRRTRVYRTNYVLRGVSIPAGEHEVEFTFRSKSFIQGAYLSGIGAGLLILSIVIAGWSHVKRRTKPVLRQG